MRMTANLEYPAINNTCRNWHQFIWLIKSSLRRRSCNVHV